MSRVLNGLSGLVTTRPIVTLLMLLAITIVLGIGITQLAPQADNTVFLPDDGTVAVATATIDEQFGGSRDTTTATLIFRGDALTPDGLAQISRVLSDATSDSQVQPLLAAPNPLASPTLLFGAALGDDDFASRSQAEIDQAAAGLPLERLVSVDENGDPVAIATIRLRPDADQDGDVEDDEDALEHAELAIRDIAVASDGPLEGGSLSPATIAAETQRAVGSDMAILVVIALVVIALVVIAVLLLLFTRSLFDLALSLLGLIITIIWVSGAQGWLGPNAIGLIGAPNTLTTMVPIMLIGLVVDYAIQTVGLYREQSAAGQGLAAARLGLRAVIIPLALAAITTIVSFLTNLSSPIPANVDFGVAAAIGVGFGLIVMLCLMSAGRAQLDRWRQSRGPLPPARPIAGAIPGVGRAAKALGGQLATRPMPFLVAVGIVTILLAIAAAQVETAFDARDFLPSNGDAIRHTDTLAAGFGGSTDGVKVLIEAELTEDRSVRNVLDFALAFSDDLRRPEGVVGEIESGTGLLLVDWITDDETEGDKFDPQLRDMTAAADQFRLDPIQLQVIVDRMQAINPQGFAAVAVNNPDVVDVQLIQFRALTGDQDRTARMLEDIEGLWFGDADDIATTSDEVTGLEVVTAMTDSQTGAIVLTILAALIILVIFFWITERRCALGFIAVGPIVLVLIWVLGTMALLNIPYNVVTALITALSIGIGVDYTIHIIHRYEEELGHLREPEAAARRTLATTGSALLGSALTTALGFGILTLSSLTPFQQFGIVTAITIAYALIAAIIVVPPMMIVWGTYQNHRLRSAVARAERQLADAPPAPEA